MSDIVERLRTLGQDSVGYYGMPIATEAADEIERLQKEVMHWREARRVCIEAGDMMKAEIEKLRKHGT